MYLIFTFKNLWYSNRDLMLPLYSILPHPPYLNSTMDSLSRQTCKTRTDLLIVLSWSACSVYTSSNNSTISQLCEVKSFLIVDVLETVSSTETNAERYLNSIGLSPFSTRDNNQIFWTRKEEKGREKKKKKKILGRKQKRERFLGSFLSHRSQWSCWIDAQHSLLFLIPFVQFKATPFVLFLHGMVCPLTPNFFFIRISLSDLIYFF